MTSTPCGQRATSARTSTSRRGGFAGTVKHARTTISIRPNTGAADWRVHIGPLTLPFQVLWVDPDDRFALFGEQNRKLGWVYGRSPVDFG